jgi:hypothetical protein
MVPANSLSSSTTPAGLERESLGRKLGWASGIMEGGLRALTVVEAARTGRGGGVPAAVRYSSRRKRHREGEDERDSHLGASGERKKKTLHSLDLDPTVQDG